MYRQRNGRFPPLDIFLAWEARIKRALRVWARSQHRPTNLGLCAGRSSRGIERVTWRHATLPDTLPVRPDRTTIVRLRLPSLRNHDIPPALDRSHGVTGRPYCVNGNCPKTRGRGRHRLGNRERRRRKCALQPPGIPLTARSGPTRARDGNGDEENLQRPHYAVSRSRCARKRRYGQVILSAGSPPCINVSRAWGSLTHSPAPLAIRL